MRSFDTLSVFSVLKNMYQMSALNVNTMKAIMSAF